MASLIAAADDGELLLLLLDDAGGAVTTNDLPTEYSIDFSVCESDSTLPLYTICQKSAREAAGGGRSSNNTHLHARPRCKRVLQLQLLPHVGDGSRGQQLQGVVLVWGHSRVRGGRCSSETSPLAEVS
jgi:hypothetical protein